MLDKPLAVIWSTIMSVVYFFRKKEKYSSFVSCACLHPTYCILSDIICFLFLFYFLSFGRFCLVFVCMILSLELCITDRQPIMLVEDRSFYGG